MNSGKLVSDSKEARRIFIKKSGKGKILRSLNKKISDYYFNRLKKKGKEIFYLNLKPTIEKVLESSQVFKSSLKNKIQKISITGKKLKHLRSINVR